MRKNVLITGASGGIGSACALAFAQSGYNVAVHYNTNEISATVLAQKCKIHGVKAVAVRADLSKSGEAMAMVQAARQSLGSIDVLINNAGIAQQKLFTDITNTDWDKMISANLSSVFYVTRAALPDMIRKKSGVIINISSIWGETGGSCEVHYSAAKAGIIGLTKALAKETAPSNVRVNCVSPGVIETKMNAGLSKEAKDQLLEETPLGRLGTVDDVVNAVLFLASEKSSFITGQVLGVNGGILI